MMLLQTPYVTEDEFNRFVMLPENRDRNFEHIAGEIVEVVSNSKSSSTAGKLFARIGVHVDDNRLGRVTGADGGYIILYLARNIFLMLLLFRINANQSIPKSLITRLRRI